MKGGIAVECDEIDAIGGVCGHDERYSARAGPHALCDRESAVELHPSPGLPEDPCDDCDAPGLGTASMARPSDSGILPLRQLRRRPSRKGRGFRARSRQGRSGVRETRRARPRKLGRTRPMPDRVKQAETEIADAKRALAECRGNTKRPRSGGGRSARRIRTLHLTGTARSAPAQSSAFSSAGRSRAAGAAERRSRFRVRRVGLPWRHHAEPRKKERLIL